MVPEVAPVGSVVKAWKTSGLVIIRLLKNLRVRFKKGMYIFIGEEGNPCPVPYKIEQIESSDGKENTYIIKLRYVDSRDDAERLRGLVVFAEKKYVKMAPFHDLTGKFVYYKGKNLGLIESVYDYPGDRMLALKYKNREILIPESFIIEVREKGVIVDLPENYLEVFSK